MSSELKAVIAIVVVTAAAFCFGAWLEHEEKMAGLQPVVEAGQ